MENYTHVGIWIIFFPMIDAMENFAEWLEISNEDFIQGHILISKMNISGIRF